MFVARSMFYELIFSSTSKSVTINVFKQLRVRRLLVKLKFMGELEAHLDEVEHIKNNEMSWRMHLS